jgi:hypothetical protein
VVILNIFIRVVYVDFIYIKADWGLHKSCDAIALKEGSGFLDHGIQLDQGRLADTVTPNVGGGGYECPVWDGRKV